MKAGIMSNPDTASDLGAAIKAMKKHEINRCHHITLTSEELWSPYSESFTVSENSYLPPHHRTSNATSSREHRSSVPAEILAPRWGTSLDIATRTLTVTTHHGIQNILSPLTRRFRTRQAQLRYPHLRTDVYSDTLFSDTKLSRGFTCGQLFVTDQDYADVFPMRSKSEAPYKLDMVCKTHGLPQMLITDNSPEETNGEWNKVSKQYLLSQQTTEPHSGWQNRAEIEIRKLKKQYCRIMHCNRCPEAFWCYGLSYTNKIRQLLARPNLDWRPPIEALTGETPDSSEYMDFDFYGWVKYKDPNNGLEDGISLGRWLGVAHSVGQAMTYWVLKSNGSVVACSIVHYDGRASLRVRTQCTKEIYERDYNACWGI
jgi:hypothetical protein